MTKWIKRLPLFVMILALALVYQACGYLVGYYQGYNAGQDDYLNFIESLK